MSLAWGLWRLRNVGDIVAQIYRSGGFGGDHVAGGDLREGQAGDLGGVREEA